MSLKLWKAFGLTPMLAGFIFAQTPPPSDKTILLGADLQEANKAVPDQAVTRYVQSLADRVAGSGRVNVRVTDAPTDYAMLLPERMLVVSSGLIGHTESEAELAAVLAHAAAHDPSFRLLDASKAESVLTRLGHCALASNPSHDSIPNADDEERANVTAVQLLRTSRYDPLGLVSIISKLRYNHPEWERAFDARQLEWLRASVEAETAPEPGYVLDSSEFALIHERLETSMGRRLPDGPPDRAMLRRHP